MSHANKEVAIGIRNARLGDIEKLDAIERMSFDGDRISCRSFRHLLTRGHCRLLVDCDADQIRGYVVVLFREGTGCARIYSIVTHPQFLKRGIASKLVKRAQAAATAKHCSELRLEIRQDNIASLRMFQQLGYLPFGTYSDYYEDGMDALRFKKSLDPNTIVFATHQ